MTPTPFVTSAARFVRVALACAGVALSTSNAWAVTQVTVCGQSVQGEAELIGDLDCSAYDGNALTLDGTLYLKGFTMRGNVSYSWAVVNCPTNCTIIGPGVVREGYHGVVAGGGIVLQDMTLDSNVHVGAGGDEIEASGVTATANELGLGGSVLDVRDSTFSGNGTAIDCEIDIFPHPRGGFCTVRDSIVSNNIGAGVVAATRLTIKGTSVTGNQGGGVQARNLRATNCVIHDNDNGGIVAEKARVRDSHVTDNQGDAIRLMTYAFHAHSTLVLVDSTVTGSAASGIKSLETYSAHLVVRRSSLTGNCTAPGGLDCADILSCHAPTVEDSTCETSHDLCNPGTSWGACSLD